jgi:hypothetical protein
MLRKSFAIVMLCAAVYAACTDAPTAPTEAKSPVFEPPVLKSYRGELVAGSLLRSDGRLVSLAGWQTYLFGRLVGAEIQIEGIRDDDPESTLTIAEFRLLAVDGHAVLDGTLDVREEGYFIRSREGMLDPLYDVPEGLARYTGRRVFVAYAGNSTMRFGLLELEN